ncbi:MAG: hypothetical protein ACTHKK_10445, partial [Candidatus Nitrosocosmicus sp.]
DNIHRVEGIQEVKVNVSNHFMAEAINKQVNESSPPAPKPSSQLESSNTSSSSESSTQNSNNA